MTYVKYHWPGQLYDGSCACRLARVNLRTPMSDHTVHVAHDRPMYAAWICHSRRRDSKRREAAGGVRVVVKTVSLLNDLTPESS